MTSTLLYNSQNINISLSYIRDIFTVSSSKRKTSQLSELLLLEKTVPLRSDENHRMLAC